MAVVFVVVAAAVIVLLVCLFDCLFVLLRKRTRRNTQIKHRGPYCCTELKHRLQALRHTSFTVRNICDHILFTCRYFILFSLDFRP